MDIVITYVNGLDPVWQAEYAQHTNTPILEKRFRDWGTLKYLFRGIEKNMPFIRKVHLVVSGESQVPEWLNRNEVNVVLHKDIIPEQLLPTFNCNPIEMHLHNIEDLDEEYLYFNDDIFPLKECKPTDFFREGRGVLGMSYHLFWFDMFKKICRNSDNTARRALGLKPRMLFLRPQHVCTPMLKSEIKALYAQIGDEIVTIGGIVGMVVRKGDDNVVIETGGERNKLRIKLWAISENTTSHERTAAEKEASKAEKKSKKKDDITNE